MKERRVEDFLSDSQVHACVGSRYGNFCILEEIIFSSINSCFIIWKWIILEKIFPYIAERIRNIYAVAKHVSSSCIILKKLLWGFRIQGNIMFDKYLTNI